MRGEYLTSLVGGEALTTLNELVLRTLNKLKYREEDASKPQ